MDPQDLKRRLLSQPTSWRSCSQLWVVYIFVNFHPVNVHHGFLLANWTPKFSKRWKIRSNHATDDMEEVGTCFAQKLVSLAGGGASDQRRGSTASQSGLRRVDQLQRRGIWHHQVCGETPSMSRPSCLIFTSVCLMYQGFCLPMIG